MMPLPDRPLSACILRTRGESILWDCGEGTQINWRRSGWPFRPTSTILLSHLHADHVAGLPGILFQIAQSGRREPVTIYGPEHTYEIASHLFTIVGRTPYDLRVVELVGGETLPLPGGLTLTTLATQHQVACLAYRLDLPRAPRFLPERARALGVPQDAWSRLQRGEAVEGVLPEHVMGVARAGLRVALVTDTRYFDELVPFVHGSDLLVCDSMYARDDQADRAAQRGHMTARQAARLAADAEVSTLWLTHFSPSVEDPAEMGIVAHEEFMNAFVGYPGMRVSLAFPES